MPPSFFRLHYIAACLAAAAAAVAAPVPVTEVTTSGSQVTSLSVNGNYYPQAQLATGTLTAFAAGAPTSVLIPNGAPAPAAGTRATLLGDWLLDTGVINPANGAATATVTFATPVVNRPGADIVFMEINPGASADAMQVTINGVTQTVASGSWGATGYATASADLYSTGTAAGSLSALESATLSLNNADISQNVFGVGIDLSDFGIAENGSVSGVSYGSTGAATFDPVFIAAITGTGAPPPGTVSLPYFESFDTGAGAFTAGAEWVATGGAYRNTITAQGVASSARIFTADLSGGPPPAFFMSSTFRVVSQTTTGNAVGFALFGTNAGFSGGVNFPYYLFDFRPGANVLRFLRVGVNNTSFLPDTTLQTMSVNAAQPFTLEVEGRYEHGALLMVLTVRQGVLSEKYYVVDTVPLTVGNFGYRNRTGTGGALTVDCDDFTLRRVSTESFTATPEPFARAGVLYSSAVAVASDIGASPALTAPSLPAWMTFTPGANGTGTLSGTPPAPGGYSVTLAAGDAEGGAIQKTFHVSVLEPAGVFISEFLAENDSGLRDEDGDQEDWIELFNSGDTAADVGGWWLSDNAATPMKWALPPGASIPARGFLVVFASGKDRAADPARLHTNFKLANSAGAHLSLALPDGTVVSSFATYPAQRADRSYGCFGSYAPSGYLLTPTPGAPNDATGYTGFVADTKFSVKRGFYSAPQSVTVTCATPGATLVYTTDGSTPSPVNGAQAASPLTLNIASTTTLRVSAFAAGLAPSGPDTQSYFFLEDIRQQSPSGIPPTGWPAGPVNGQILQYGMDPDITGSVTAQQMKDALSALPTLSLVTDLANLFDPAKGIYVNPYGREEGYECPVSVELLNADNSPGFHINAGLRIRGGFSRQGTNPKHNFHLYFRGEYGAPVLKYRLFGDDGADEFDRIDLRTAQVASWHNNGDTNATYNRDEWNRLTHGAMGQPYTRSRYYHLYINGHYWGIYGTQERADSAFASSYFGGRRGDYDVMKTYVIPHRVEAADGDNAAWSQLFDAATAGFASDPAYFAVQGLDAAGQPAGPALLDVDSVIDYTLLRYYAGDNDAPVNTGVGGGVPKNFYAIRPRDGRFGYRFFTHDAESTMNSSTTDVTGTISVGNTLAYFNPRWLSQQLAANAKYRLRFADRAQRHLFNGGALDTPVGVARWQDLRAQLSGAMLAESARWGDAKSSTPRTVANWNAACDSIENGFLVSRRANLIAQLRSRSLFPPHDAPVFSQHGGSVSAGFALQITTPPGTTAYFTSDGSDPMSEGATPYTAPVPLSGVQLTVKARARLNSTGQWSALTEAMFTFDATPAAAGSLVFSEIHYNPPGGTDDVEFVELVNTAPFRLDLSGVALSGAVVFTFGNVTLEPGARILVVEDIAAFIAAYGSGLNIAGQWSGALNNGGDTLILRDGGGVEIEQIAYEDSGEWPAGADGDGYSLVRISHTVAGGAANWRTSTTPGGNPGASDSVAFTADPLADADGDRLTALVEHLLATSDAVANPPPISGGRTPDGRATITFTRRLAADDLACFVEVNTGNAGWSTETTRIAHINNGDGTATETWAAATTGTGTQLMRLRVVK